MIHLQIVDIYDSSCLTYRREVLVMGIEVICTVMVAKKESKYFKKFVSIVTYNSEYYWCEHNGGIPSKPSKEFKPLTYSQAEIILPVMREYQEHKNYYTGGYAWLVVGCYYKGLDLIDKGFVSL